MAVTKHVLIIGATGIVGRGIVAKLTEAGYAVIGIGRDPAKLHKLAADVPGIRTIAGSIENNAEAGRLRDAVAAAAPRLDIVITSVNTSPAAGRLLDMPAQDLLAALQANVITHHVAAQTFIPTLDVGATYIGIGGGMADFTFADMGPVSVCQAAQRNLFRFYGVEAEKMQITVLELMLFSMILDDTADTAADPRSIRAGEVGTHITAMLQQPALFAGPILSLKSRKQVGQPERAP